MDNGLRLARRLQLLTQEQLSTLSGVSRPTIASIEHGNVRDKKLGTLIKLADALGTTVPRLFFDEDGN